MQTHEDMEHRTEWLKSVMDKAARAQQSAASVITAGAAGEHTVARWKSNGIEVCQRPDDEHGILRISVGGGDTPVPCDYLVFRGDHSKCVDLLRKALRALEAGPLEE